MGQTAKPPRENRTLTIDFNDEATYAQLLDDGKAFIEFVLAFILSIGFQFTHKATCTGGGCLTRHSHYARVRLGGLTLWRMQCTSCKAVFTVLPHFVLRYRRMSPDVARQALLATHGGLSLEWCATICHISPMALYRLICALGQHSLVLIVRNLWFLSAFGETRQFADFLAFFGMQRGGVAYVVTGEHLLSSLRLGCHPHGITKSGQEPVNSDNQHLVMVLVKCH